MQTQTRAVLADSGAAPPKVDPNSSGIRRALNTLLPKLGSKPEAKRIETVEHIYSSARDLLQEGKLQEAEVLFRKAYERRPASTPIRLGLARVLRDLGKEAFSVGRHDEARDLWTESLDYNSDQQDIIRLLGASYALEGHYEDAERTLLLAWRKNPKDGLVLLHLGTVYFNLKQFEKAAQAFSQSLDLRPNDPNVKYWLSRCEHALGDKS